MAKRGLSTFLHAELMADNTYGEVKKTGGAIDYNESINTNNYKHYEDNELQWEDSSFKDGTIKLTVGDDKDDVFAELLGHQKKTVTVNGVETEIYEKRADGISKAVGFGLIENIRDKSGYHYRVKFYLSVTFKPYSTESKTKNDSSDYSTQAVEGTIATVEGAYERHKTVDTLEEAIAILYAFFGKDVPGSTETQTPDAEGSESTDTENTENVEVQTYTQEELEALTIDQIKVIADERGYTITKSVKAEIIEEFLAVQNA